eukprot:6050916-Alexandrium_andersonii.AAC.1
MSASLVGSEMCIRDSQRAPRVQGFPALERGSCQQKPIRQGRVPSCGIGPVSYTHLTLPTICSV